MQVTKSGGSCYERKNKGLLYMLANIWGSCYVSKDMEDPVI